MPCLTHHFLAYFLLILGTSGSPRSSCADSAVLKLLENPPATFLFFGNSMEVPLKIHVWAGERICFPCSLIHGTVVEHRRSTLSGGTGVLHHTPRSVTLPLSTQQALVGIGERRAGTHGNWQAGTWQVGNAVS